MRSSIWVGVALLALAACSQPAEPLKITGVDLSHEVDANNEPRSARETFAPSSTIYASIATEGGTEGTLAARWTDPQGGVIAEQKQTVHPTHVQRFEFHVAPSPTWPLGRYKVVITLDGGTPKSREYEIR